MKLESRQKEFLHEAFHLCCLWIEFWPCLFKPLFVNIIAIKQTFNSMALYFKPRSHTSLLNPDLMLNKGHNTKYFRYWINYLRASVRARKITSKPATQQHRKIWIWLATMPWASTRHASHVTCYFTSFADSNINMTCCFHNIPKEQ